MTFSNQEKVLIVDEEHPHISCHKYQVATFNDTFITNYNNKIHAHTTHTEASVEKSYFLPFWHPSVPSHSRLGYLDIFHHNWFLGGNQFVYSQFTSQVDKNQNDK